jgi:hypothetical protein
VGRLWVKMEMEVETETEVDMDMIARLVRKDHEIRIQHDRIKNMTSNHNSQRYNHTPHRRRNLPLKRYKWQSQNDHTRHDDKRADQGYTEPDEDLGYFEEKVGSFDFLFCCSPLDVVAEHVCEDGFGEMDRQTTKEDEAARVNQVRNRYRDTDTDTDTDALTRKEST